MSDELKVIFGGHWSNHPGWIITDYPEHDITKPLKFDDETVDVIFTEHVIEHVSFVDAIFFMREAKRILKPGGVIRTVCPMLDKLLSFSINTSKDRTATDNNLNWVYGTENKLLKEIGLDGYFESPKTFVLNSLFREHGHQFIWDVQLMIKVLKALGFSKAKEYGIDEGSNPEYCINRQRRGVYSNTSWEEDRLGEAYDLESNVVEAIK